MLFVCGEAVESNLVKQETSLTVILPPTASVLWQKKTHIVNFETCRIDRFFVNSTLDIFGRCLKSCEENVERIVHKKYVSNGAHKYNFHLRCSSPAEARFFNFCQSQNAK